MFGELPVSHTFTGSLFAGVYFPGRHLPTEVRFEGDLTFRFAETEDPNLLAISVEALRLTVVPCLLPLPERLGNACVELRDVEITDALLDREATRGQLNLATGEMTLNWSFDISASAFPLMEVAGAENFKVRFEDRGFFDFDNGSYEIHHGVMEIAEGPLAGTVIRGSGCGEISASSTITLTVAIASAGANCETTTGKEVWICPGDSILLCWKASSDVNTVDLGPGGFTGLNPVSSQLIKPTAGSGNVEYKATTVGGYSVAEDKVSVHILTRGQAIRFAAKPNPEKHRWEAFISPNSYSAKLIAEEVELLQMSTCLDWKKFMIEHLPHFGGITVDGYKRHKLPYPSPTAGSWFFYAAPDPMYGSGKQPYAIENGPQVCFTLRGYCK
jgi:hypothetical protein